jgi:outer membrane immunogenic protein
MSDVSKTIRLGLAIVALMGAVAGHQARAADMPAAPMLKAPMRAPIYDWTGFYLGANGGGSGGRSTTDVVLNTVDRFLAVTGQVPLGSTSGFLLGGLGGVQAGYNWQTSAAVVGFETDIQGTSEKGDGVLTAVRVNPAFCIAPCPPGPPPAPTFTTGMSDYAQKLPWFGTARARVGFTPLDRWLVYATGGLAYGEVQTDASVTVAGAGTSTGSFSQTRVGWVAGAGVEAALGGGWTGKVEYLHLDFGSFSNTYLALNSSGLFSGFIAGTSHVTDEIVRVGVNYRLGGAVVAKY